MSGEPTELEDLAAELGVEHILAALAERDSTALPVGLEERVVAHARANRRGSVAPLDPREVYAARVDGLRTVLSGLSAEDWGRAALPYDWTVHELLAHLVVIEEYTLTKLGVGSPPEPDTAGHLTIGAGLIRSLAAGPPASTLERWSNASRLVVERVHSARFAADAPVTLHGWPFTGASALIARAFEIWTHTDDILRAVGLPLVQPTPEELSTMSSFSVRSLPLLLPGVARSVPMSSTRIVLTGAGGGVFELGGPGPTSATLTLDVVDYCRVAARRIVPDEVRAMRDGDGVLIDALLRAASLFAV